MPAIGPQTASRLSSQLAAWARDWLNAPAGTAADALAGFESVLGTLDAFQPEGQADASAPSLLLSLTTHRRPDAAARVVTALGESLEALGHTVGARFLCVLEDPSSASYACALEALTALDRIPALWLRGREHLGKQGYWRMWHAALSVAQRVRPDYALFIQDDLDFDRDLLGRALELLRALEAKDGAGRPRPQVLSLFSTDDDERFGRWVFYPRRQLRALPVRQTQWFDLPAVLMNRAALEVLGYQVFPIAAERWQHNPSASSGVGRQLTRRLFARASIHQCAPSLVFHGAEPSAMNPDARGERAMDNRAERTRRGS